MSDNADKGLTATHLYGTAGLILAIIGLIVSINSTTGITGWLLFASGWLVCLFLAWFLLKTSGRLTDIIDRHDRETAESSKRVATLEARVLDLQKEIDRRHSTLDYLSSLLMTGPALPRTPNKGSDQEIEEA